jgi:hypothetical protein
LKRRDALGYTQKDERVFQELRYAIGDEVEQDGRLSRLRRFRYFVLGLADVVLTPSFKCHLGYSQVGPSEIERQKNTLFVASRNGLNESRTGGNVTFSMSLREREEERGGYIIGKNEPLFSREPWVRPWLNSCLNWSTIPRNP